MSKLFPPHPDGWCRLCTGAYGWDDRGKRFSWRECKRCNGTGKEPKEVRKQQ